MTKQIFFRADSNAKIASGHIMRCLSIAKQFRKVGCDVCFVTADDLSDAMLSGFDHLNLHSDWNNLSIEISKMKELLKSCSEKPILIIDTYSINADYVDALAPYAIIVYLGSKSGYLGHLNYQINYSAKTDPEYYTSLYGDSVQVLLGLKYTPLREEFQNILPHNSQFVKRILITTGNTDVQGYVSKILNYFIVRDFSSDVVFDVVVGRLFGHIEELEDLSSQNANIILHHNVTRMSDLMINADLSISAAGNTILELAAAKVPQIVFSMVEEQTKSAREFEELGIIDYCGEIYSNQQNCINCIYERVLHYIEKTDERFALSKHAASYVDGLGCERIVNTLLY